MKCELLMSAAHESPNHRAAAAGPSVDERYGLNWPGKADALRAVNSACATRLVARRDLSLDFDAAEHAIVEGDNLDVLKLLATSCAGTVKLVYIDPPYNRGHDRLYPDDYSVSRKTYAESANHIEDGRSGHLHAQWLSMMAPRLALARRLMHPTGIIAVSIDQLEVSRLRLLMEELFGEENFVAEIVVSLNPKGRQLAPFFATSHEYLLVFARDVRETALVAASKDGVDPRDFPHEDARGRYRLLPLRNTNKKFNPTSSRSMHFAVWARPEDGRVGAEPFEGAVEVLPVFGDGSSAVWRWSAPRIAQDADQLVARSVKGRLGTRLDVYQIDRLTPERTKKLRTIWTSAEIGSTDDAVSQLKALVGPVFPTPKPVGLVRRLLDTMPKDALVLDFFAGSGTTGQAVIEANADDGGSRRCVLVQAAEPTIRGGDAAQLGLDTIAAITRARVRSTIERLRAAGGSSTDVGFRAFETAPIESASVRSSDEDLLLGIFDRGDSRS